MSTFHALFSAALLLTGSDLQEAPVAVQEPPVTVLDDVVVNGQSLAETVDEFVKVVTNPPPGHGPARWDRRVCVGVVNLQRDAAQVVIDRVSEAAALIDLTPLEPGCRPNILVIATDQANDLANALVESEPNAFRPRYSGASQSARTLEAFRSSSKPVRWWHVSMPVIRDSNTPAVRLPGQGGPMIPGSGRLTTEVTNRLLRSFVILDITRMESTNFQQVGDYVAMVALAQIDPDADTSSFDTVMNLFSDPDHSENLTEWDQAYLRALYGAYMNQRNANAQIGSIGNVMFRDRRIQERETPSPASSPVPVP